MKKGGPPTAEDFAGKGWPKSYKHHEAIRKLLQERFKEPVPTTAEWIAEHFKENEWMQHMPARKAGHPH